MNKLTVTALGLLACAALTLGQGEQAKPDGARLVEEAGQGSTATASHALEETLINLEKQSWAAWQKRDGKFFQDFLSDDHVEVGFGGVTRNKATIVAGVASPVCVVKSYTVERFELTMLDANTALLTYHAAQDTTCGSTVVPSPVWVGSLYVRRSDRWLNAFYQQTQTRK
jgi:hypothetical protein